MKFDSTETANGTTTLDLAVSDAQRKECLSFEGAKQGQLFGLDGAAVGHGTVGIEQAERVLADDQG